MHRNNHSSVDQEQAAVTDALRALALRAQSLCSTATLACAPIIHLCRSFAEQSCVPACAEFSSLGALAATCADALIGSSTCLLAHVGILFGAGRSFQCRTSKARPARPSIATPSQAAKIRYPGIFEGVDTDTETWILDSMRIVRPVVETGYENVLLVRLLLEIKVPHLRKSSVAEKLSVDDILADWEHGIKPVVMKEWNESNKEELVELFGKVRDDWMEHDLHGWIGANRFYPGTADALKFSSSTVFIVTTKQARFTSALLKEIAGIDFPEDRIYGLGSGPKVEVLKKLQEREEHEGLTLHFVEDRLATLRNVIKTPALDKWNLYLGTWGYNTPIEREAAASISRIHVVDLPNFCAKLK